MRAENALREVHTIEHDFRVLILAPHGRDAELIAQVLDDAAIACVVCGSARDLVVRLCEGAAAALIAEEALGKEEILLITRVLEKQEPWSDFPIVVITGSGEPSLLSRHLATMREPLGNVSLQERPLRTVTLVSSIQSVIRARQKQYEIRDHLLTLRSVEQELRSNQQRLESEVAKRTAALRLLSSRLMRAQDEERRRLARELHDSLGQYLAGGAMAVEALAAANPCINQAKIGELRDLIQRCIAETRTLSHLLHPPLLDEVGLTHAIKWFVEQYIQRSGIAVTLTIDSLERLPAELETMLFRVIQEALTNVHKHANSQTAAVSLKKSEGGLVLEISDEGHGMSPDVMEDGKIIGSRTGVGLAGMRERVTELGGTLSVRSGSTGTKIKVSLPAVSEY